MNAKKSSKKPTKKGLRRPPHPYNPKKKPLNQNRPLLKGTISIHPKGFGFVKTGSTADVFIPKHRIQHAVHGDEVEIEITSTLSPKGPEGSVLAILKRARSVLAGIVIDSMSKDKVQVYAPLLGVDKPLIVEAKSHRLEKGDRILCKIESWGEEANGMLAHLVKKIGHISDPSIDVEAAIAEFELPHDFSIEAVEEAKAYGKKISLKEAKSRVDLTEEECVTIDPDTAKDFDDAITLTQDAKGNYLLGVHIADVAHYVKPHSILDQEAFERCNSTYFPGRCVPMLPEELSNELCSLKPKVKRLTQSVLAKFNSNGDLISYEVVRSVIKSKKRFTYKEALLVLEGKKKSPHKELLERMVAFCHLLKKKRMERGSIDLALHDDVILVDSEGNPKGIERVEYDITHQMIEEFMLKANELVAIYLGKKKQQLIYRVHEEPSKESYQDFFTLARSFGFFLPPKPTHIDIQKLFQEAKGSALLPQLSVSFIRSMKLAAYSSDNIGHYGLALEHYCHFTSPIRRYSDLIIQRLLFEEIPLSKDLEEVALRCSERERVSFRAESSVTLLKKLRLASTYFAKDPTQTYPAIVTKIKPFSLFFEIPLFDLEGSLHISEIGDDYYQFNQERLCFEGVHTGKGFVMGEMIQVQIQRIDLILQQVSFTIVKPGITYAKKVKRAKKTKKR